MGTGMKRLAATVVAIEDDALAGFPFDEQRKRLLATLDVAPPARARRLAPLFALAGVAALVAIVVGVRRQQPLRVSVVAGETGRATSFVFSDGTSVSLSPETHARVIRCDYSGAHIVLEDGRLAAKVVHRDDTTDWRIDAGPFTVAVVGTRFDVEWDPARRRFELAMTEGAVRVSGPGIDGARVFVAGERFATVVADEAAPAADAPLPLLPALPTPAPTAPERALRATRLAPARPPSPPPEAVPQWRPAARAGRHTEAWELIAGASFDVIAREADAADLALLADVARFAEHPAEGAWALLELRRRFPADAHGTNAAFLLGRLAADQGGEPATAARWFSTYLEEEPNGAFAEQAAGRLIECHRLLGAAGAARAAAARYLDIYPTGAYATAARRALSAP